jgi:hypothetical protein
VVGGTALFAGLLFCLVWLDPISTRVDGVLIRPGHSVSAYLRQGTSTLSWQGLSHSDMPELSDLRVSVRSSNGQDLVPYQPQAGSCSGVGDGTQGRCSIAAVQVPRAGAYKVDVQLKRSDPSDGALYVSTSDLTRRRSGLFLLAGVTLCAVALVLIWTDQQRRRGRSTE